MWEVFTSDRRVRSSVPKGAKDAWSRCFITALADVVAHRDLKPWTDLLTLPALVLPAPSRGGRKHVLRHEGEVWRRCLDWLSGIRADLWAPLPVRTGKHRCPPAQDDDSDVLQKSVVTRVTTLIQEGSSTSSLRDAPTGSPSPAHGGSCCLSPPPPPRPSS